MVLSVGTQINKNDTLVKIHLHNVRLLKEIKNMNSKLKKAKVIFNYVKRSLPGIDLYIQNQPIQFYVLCGKNIKLYEKLKRLQNHHVIPSPYISCREKMNDLYDQMMRF